ncbi:MAG: ABC transporter substrate-binding protein [Thiohalocapsa sp.]
MRRRDLLAFFCASAAAWPARAQAPTTHYRIAMLQPDGRPGGWRKWPLGQAFSSELHRLGDIEGENLLIEEFSGEGQVGRYADVARRVAAANPDVIVAFGDDIVPAVLAATRTIPVVAVMGYAVKLGFVKSLSHPGGNLTGVNVYDGETDGKVLQLLAEAVPSVARVGVLEAPAYDLYRASLRDHAAKLGLSLIVPVLRESTPEEIEHGFAELARQHADALLVAPEGALAGRTPLIVRLAAEHRLPAMYPNFYFVQAGGLMAYSWEPTEVGRRLADDVHRILKGAKPGDIPIYQSTRFRLTLNQNAAKAIGFAFPPEILVRADEVIEEGNPSRNP